MRSALVNLILCGVIVFLASIAIGNERVPVCDVDGEAVPGSVVEVRMMVDGVSVGNWRAGMCPRVIERLQEKLEYLIMDAIGPYSCSE